MTEYKILNEERVKNTKEHGILMEERRKNMTKEDDESMKETLHLQSIQRALDIFNKHNIDPLKEWILCDEVLGEDNT